MIEDNFFSPEIVATHFHLRAGDRVADFGAGTGNFSKVLSKLVGDDGRVYACEIQKDLAETLSENIRKERMINVEVLWCDIEEDCGTKIREGSLDAAVLVNTLFQFEQKEIAMQEIYRTLRSGGRLLMVDWSESWGGLGPQPTNVVTEHMAIDLAETAGFTFERQFVAGKHHYGLAFRK